MNAQQLKNSILQYAIQGKLVPQDPNEKPAVASVKLINEKKVKLMEEKLIKKEKPFPLISEDEKPFDIPESWEWVRLADIVSILGDGIHGTPSYNPKGDYYFINGNNLKSGIISINDNTKKVSREEFMKYKKELNNSSILVSINGTIGNIAFYNNERVMLGKSACYFNLIPIESKRYVYWLLQSKYFLDYALKQATGTTIKNVSLKTMKSFIIPFPPLAEQERIADKVGYLVEKIQDFSTKNTTLQDLQSVFPNKLENSILHYAMQGKLVEQDPNDEPAADLVKCIREEKERLIEEKIIKKENALPPINNEEIPFDIPENWEWVRLGDISSKIHYGYTASAQEKGNAKLLRITDIQKNQVIWGNVPYCNVDKKKLDSIVLKERDILIARTGGTIGKSFLISDVKEVSVFASYLIRVQPLTKVNEIYLTYFLQSEIYWRQLKEMSAGTGQPNVNSQNLKKLLLPLPPLEEQARIIKEIRNFFDITKKLVGTNSK